MVIHHDHTQNRSQTPWDTDPTTMGGGGVQHRYIDLKDRQLMQQKQNGGLKLNNCLA